MYNVCVCGVCRQPPPRGRVCPQVWIYVHHFIMPDNSDTTSTASTSPSLRQLLKKAKKDMKENRPKKDDSPVERRRSPRFPSQKPSPTSDAIDLVVVTSTSEKRKRNESNNATTSKSSTTIKKKTTNETSQKKRGKGYTSNERMNFLNLMSALESLPINMHSWDQLAVMHNSTWKQQLRNNKENVEDWMDRTGASIKAQFESLYRT